MDIPRDYGKTLRFDYTSITSMVNHEKDFNPTML